jgi:transcriptional regulator
MYNPVRFQGSEEQIEEIVASHPLATLVTVSEGELFTSHLPLVLEKREGEWFLIGHLARANPHGRVLERGNTLAIFHGPQTYITPLWYQECDVPTWNYVVAQLEGKARLLEAEADTTRALRVLSERMERKDGWKFEIPQDLAEPGVLMKSIVGFEIRVDSKSAKLKLSQNKQPLDFDGVLRGLKAERSDEQSQRVAQWMERVAKGN